MAFIIPSYSCQKHKTILGTVHSATIKNICIVLPLKISRWHHLALRGRSAFLNRCMATGCRLFRLCR